MTASLKWHRVSPKHALALTTCVLVLTHPVVVAAEPLTVESGSILLEFFEAGLFGDEAVMKVEYRNLTLNPDLPPPDFSTSIWIAAPTSAWRFDHPVTEIDVTRPPLPDRIEDGASFNLSARVSWTDGELFSAPRDCCPGDPLAPTSAGSFVITAGDAVLESHFIEPDFVWFSGSAPFTFSGGFQVRHSVTGAPYFEQTLQGGGTAHFSLFPNRFNYFYDIHAIPEPATLLLLGCGALGLAARRNVRRRSSLTPHGRTGDA